MITSTISNIFSWFMLVSNFVVISEAVFCDEIHDLQPRIWVKSFQVGLDTRTAGWSRYQTIHFWRSSPLFTHISIEVYIDMSYIWRCSPIILDPQLFTGYLTHVNMSKTGEAIDDFWSQFVLRILQPHPCTNFIQFPHQPID